MGILNPWSVGEGVETADSLSDPEEAEPSSEELSPRRPEPPG